jgi:hypothetical protein
MPKKQSYSYNDIPILILLFFFGIQAYGQKEYCDHYIENDNLFINGVTHQAGDTFCLVPGTRGPLYIGDIRGDSSNPIVFINDNGVVNIESEIGYGISISNCQYIKILGSGGSEEYGIKISSVTNGSGIKAGMKTSDIEISNLEISNTKYIGITAKTDPDCSFSSVMDSFTMYNTHIHHNYIHHVGTEAIYIGNSFFTGFYVSGCDTTVTPHILDGVDIHHNIIEYCGWDGIQLGCALYNSKIHHNQISYDSQDEHIYQMSGIMVNPGSACDVYNNIIMNGKGTGIALQGPGGQKIYNNLIINSGRGYIDDNQTTAQKFGIYCKYEINHGNDSSFLISQNTIINPKSDGIRFQNSHSIDNKIFNNIIVNPGAYDYYDTNGNLSNMGEDSYVYVYYSGIDINIENNLFNRIASPLYFKDTLNHDYQLTSSSPAINTGLDLSYYGIDFDLNDEFRPFYTLYDIGAYEYTGVGSIEINQNELQLLPNPFSNYLKIISTGNDKILELVIRDIAGRVYYSEKNIDIETINLDYLPEGLYIIEIKTNYVESFIYKALKI